MLRDWPWWLQSCVREVRLVLCICLPISELNINPTRWHGTLLDGKIDSVEVRRFRQRTESVKALATLIEKIHPRSRGLRVLTAGWQIRRRCEEIGRVLIFVRDVVMVTNEGFAAGLKGFTAG